MWLCAGRPTVYGGSILIDNRSRVAALASLTDTDRRLLALLSEQRVLTQTQLERLLPETPPRTLRYRSERLARFGLVGRSRPYREKGSAPFHYWPTRASDAFVRAEPVPRGGERSEPNPQFLQHAERLSELYVLLKVQAPTVGLHLQQFKREGAGREAFRADGHERALAPDALIHLRDEDGRGLLGFVELDLGTMSHARLKTKAAGYAGYAAEAAWAERHPFCPCLLFLTATERRVLAFLKLLSGLLEKQGRGSYYGRRRGFFDWFAATSCAHAREPERALVEAYWDGLAPAGGGLSLVDCLNKARAAYDATRAKEEAKQRAREAERARLRADAAALRAHLQEHTVRLGGHLSQFGSPGAAALGLLLAAGEPMTELEQDAFAAIVRQLDDDLLDAKPAPAPVPPTWSETQAVELLVDVYRRRQRTRLDELARRYGVGPLLRSHRNDLNKGELLSPTSWAALEGYAQRDHESRQEQERLRVAYLTRRDQDARDRKHQLGLTARIAHGRTAAFPLVDRERLRICGCCNEIAYPSAKPERDHYGTPVRRPAARCPFCSSSDLAPWDPGREPEVEYAALGVDLTSAGIDGSMHSHEGDEEEVFGL
ncbi:MAG TPA: replication-relaxation family protein [Gaiellaceae bacterium]|nr:replication-relaxation family protein [Gaiellaceae bacterium]